jgi:hypothetical protein
MLFAGALGVLASGAMAGPAPAATPFTAGTGSNPGVAVGSDGSGHVVWATPNPTQVGYCRAAAGAAACNRSLLLPFPGGPSPQTTGRPVVSTPAPNKVVVVAGCWSCGAGGTEDRTYRWTSFDNGETFGLPATQIGTGITTQGTGTWIEDADLFVGASSSSVKAAIADGTEGVQYATGGVFVYGPEVVRVGATSKLVAATNDLDIVKYGVYKGASLTAPNVNAVVNWEINKTLPAAEGDNGDTDLNSGPNGVYLTYRYFVPNDNRVGLRRFDPATNTFGAATYIEGSNAIDNNSLDYPDSFQDASGRIHAIWRTLYDGQRLRYTVSDTAGANFSPVANLARQEGFYNPALAAGADGKGFAVWTPNNIGTVRIVALDPQPEPITAPPPGGGGTPPPDTTGPTIRPVFRFTGPGNRLTARIVGRRIKIRMKGAIVLPAGANPATACTGKVRLKIKKKKRTMLNRTVKVKFRNGKCRFAKTVFLKRSKVGKTRRLKLKIRFMGNTVLKAGSVSRTLIIRK